MILYEAPWGPKITIYHPRCISINDGDAPMIGFGMSRWDMVKWACRILWAAVVL